MRTLRRAAVIGSGVMGSQIAAHLAGSGISCLLLDIVPDTLLPEEEAAGWTKEHPSVRNRLAVQAVERLKKARPPVLYDPRFAERITPGNLEDDLHRLSETDWMIEAVVEDPDVKKRVLRTIESVWKPGIVVSTNTSGISIRDMTADAGEPFRRHFLGTHFFNPPRHMKLLEIVPGEHTDPQIVEFMADFCERRLGKGVVVAKDTPNFIANRIGIFVFLTTIREMLANGLTVEEADAVTGPVMGRPGSATFRTLDYVGIDVLAHASRNVERQLTDEREAALFQTPAIVRELVGRGWIGEKKGQGFYRKTQGAAGTVYEALNLHTLAYEPVRPVASASLEAAGNERGAADKLRALLSVRDRYSDFAWNVLKHTLIYSAEKCGEIADSIVDIDRAMKWGYNWELGPFEMWDAIGLESSVRRMEAEGLNVPGWVKRWVAAGNDSFYRRGDGARFYVHAGTYKKEETRPGHLSLRTLKEAGKTVLSNGDASLIDIGDDVVCLEFHSKGNAIGGASLEMILRSVEETEKRYRGLVIANEGKNFCTGANIAELLSWAEAGAWDELDERVRTYQRAVRALRGLGKPTVAAPHQRTLGYGVELCMAVDAVLFSPETYFGLVETAIGVLPAGGGCVELASRASRQAAPPDDLQPAINRAFDAIVEAKTSTSGHDAERLGFMRAADAVVANADFRIHEAKQLVLKLSRDAYVPSPTGKIRVVGDNGKAVLLHRAYEAFVSGRFTEHDRKVAGKVAHVLAGGDVPAGARVTESHMYDLEREAFLHLLGEEKTRQRIAHLLKTGKPLRN